MKNQNKPGLDLSTTKRELLELLLAQEGLEHSRPDAIPRREEDRTAPLSYAQERLWFLDQLMPGSAFYNVPLALRLEGELELDLLVKSLNAIVKRHEVLRTRFAIIEGKPVQVIAEQQEVGVEVIDIRSTPECDREEEMQRLANQDAAIGFDLSKGPLIRMKIVRTGERTSVLLFTMHHIVSDAWSLQVLIKEVTELYEANKAGREARLPDLEIQYADYAVWQRKWLEEEVLEEQLSYWRSHLGERPPVLELPTDRARPATQSYRGAIEEFEIRQELSEKLKQLSQAEGMTIYMTLLAGFKALLGRYSGQDEIVVGMPIAGRNREEIEKLIGFFVNTLVLKTDLKGNPSVREVLRRVREVTLGAYEHQDVPFEKLVEELQPDRSLSHAPLVQVVFNFINEPTQLLELSDISLSPVRVETETSKFDLTLTVMDRGIDLTGNLCYHTDLFDESTINRLLEHYLMMLEGMVANPDQPISKVPILTSAEKRQLIVEWNNTTLHYPADKCAHQIFEQQAVLAPNAIALTFEESQLTYEQLNQRANQLAHYLRVLGVGPEACVAVCLERSVEMVVALLATLKAGGAYLPLDPDYPRERLAFMLKDAQPVALITEEGLLEGGLASGAQVVNLKADWERIAGQSDANPDSKVCADNLAYMIYTSGSTGTPKGVLVCHANITRLFDSTREWFSFNEKDVWMLFHSFAFDFSVWELWGPLLHGGRLVIVPRRVSRSPEAFMNLLAKEQVTILNQTPSAFRQLARADETGGGGKELAVRAVILGGEALEPESLRGWFDRRGDERPRLINMYGITETTVHVTYRPITKSDLDTATGSLIGRAIRDLKLYILDKNLEPAPIGAGGEIYVGGDGLARGYLARPDLTASRFIPDPFSDEPGARLYRSGDLARYKGDGDIEYLGRIDQQVKVRGYRIELGEIEAALSSSPKIRETVVLALEDTDGDKSLAAYVVSKDGEPLTTSELRAFLKEKLPDYMLPSVFVMLEKLPLSVNGKLDRKALPLPEQIRPSIGEAYVAPRNALEKFLAEKLEEVLKITKVGVYDNFFELGGDSIKAAVFINRLQEELGQIVHVVVLFDAPRIADLASYMTEHYPNAVAKMSGFYPDLAKEPESRIERIDAEKVAEMRSLIAPLAPRRSQMLESLAKNRPAIFVLSPPRSGSTLLRVMMGGHPLLFAPPELELLTFNTLEERKAALTGRYSFYSEGAIRAAMEVKRCDAEEARKIIEDYERRGFTTRQFYNVMQGWIGEKTLVDKTAYYALDLEILKRAEADFDDALYIHLLRSPQGMIRSFEESKLDQIYPRFKHGFTPRQAAELIWVISQQNILEFLKSVPAERQHQVKFEELVKEPEAVMRQLCEFIGIEFDPGMTDPYTEREKKMTDGIHGVSHMVGDIKFHQHKKIDAEVAESWKSHYTNDYLGEITKQLAESLGYANEANAIRPGISIDETLTAIQSVAGDEGVEQILSNLNQFSDEDVDSLLREMLDKEQGMA